MSFVHLKCVVLTIIICCISIAEKYWVVQIEIPCTEIVEYRYFIASKDPLCEIEEVHVRKWETHFKPRAVPRDAVSSLVETFGIVDDVEKIDRGWLTNETMFEFKFLNNPLILKERMKNRLLFIKITPMNMRTNAESYSAEDGSLSCDTRENSSDQPGEINRYLAATTKYSSILINTFSLRHHRSRHTQR